MARKSVYQTFLTNAAMRANIGIAGNPPMKDELYYCFETGKQGYWYWDVGASNADDEGLVIVTTTGSHRLKRVFLNSSYVFQNWFTGTGDAWWTSVAAANAAIIAAHRKRGMRVFIMEAVVEEYWYRDGTADGDLVPVAGEIGVDNGPTTDGAFLILSAPNPNTILADSILIEGINGVTVDASQASNLMRFTIDGDGLSQFSIGTLAQRPAFGNLGRQYYQTDQRQGVYRDTGFSWAFLPDQHCLVDEKWLGNLPVYYAGSVTNSGQTFIDADTPGRWRIETNTVSSSGSAAQRLSQNMFGSMAGISKIIFYVENVEVNSLSTSGERYVLTIGRSIGSDVNGMWWEYSDNINSGKWLNVNYNGTRTTSDTGITVATATKYTFCAVYDFAGTDNIKYYINGTQVGSTHTTNLPANFTGGYFGSFGIQKSVGTGNRAASIGQANIIVIPSST